MNRIALALLIVLMGCSSGTADEAKKVGTTSTTEKATTTEAPTTTRVVTEEDHKAIFQIAFDAFRVDLAEELESDVFLVERVDRLEYDAGQGAIVLDATSRYGNNPYFADNNRDVAFEVAQTFTSFYEEIEDYYPHLHMNISGTSAKCSSDFMVRLTERRAGRAEFDAECL